MCIPTLGMVATLALTSGCCGGSGFSTSTAALASSAIEAANCSVITLTSKQHSPTGNITFYNGSTSPGNAVPLSTGTATLSVASLPVGLNSLTTVYSGDSHDSSATSPAVSQRITAQTEVEIQGTSGSLTHATTIQITLQ